MASGRDSRTTDKPMDERQRKRIRIHMVELARDMEPRQLIHHMADVLTPIDEEEIKASSTRWGQCEKLLDILPRRGEKAFYSFVKALKEVHPFLADLLVDAEMKPRTEDESSAECQQEEDEDEQKEVDKLLKEVYDGISVKNRKKEGRKETSLEAAFKEPDTQPQEASSHEEKKPKRKGSKKKPWLARIQSLVQRT